MGVDQGRTGAGIQSRDTAPGEVPLHAEFLQRSFLHLHELGLDLHLPDFAVTGNNISNPLQVARGLGDDQRRPIIGQRRALNGEAHARLLKKGLQRRRFIGSASTLARLAAPRFPPADCRSGTSRHAQDGSPRHRKEVGIQRARFASRPNDNRVDLHLVLVANARSHKIEHPLQARLPKHQRDLRPAVFRIEEHDVDALHPIAGRIELLRNRTQRADHLANLGARETHLRQHNVVQLAPQSRGRVGDQNLGIRGHRIRRSLPALFHLLQ